MYDRPCQPTSGIDKILFIFIGAAALVVAGAIAGGVVLLSGGYSITATKQHCAVTYRILELGLRHSVASRAAKMAVPMAAGFMGVMPASALLLSYVLLDEVFKWLHLLGFGVVFAGVLLISWGHARMHRH